MKAFCESVNLDAFIVFSPFPSLRVKGKTLISNGGKIREQSKTDETDGLLDLIKNEQPELIVAHLSTFESEKKDRKIDILKEITQDIAKLDPSYFPSLILYSRLPRGKTKGELSFPSRDELLGEENSDISFFATIAMVGDSDSDADCFLGNSENTQRLREQVNLAISHQNLYGRDFSK